MAKAIEWENPLCQLSSKLPNQVRKKSKSGRTAIDAASDRAFQSWIVILERDATTTPAPTNAWAIGSGTKSWTTALRADGVG
jgi:hypothetical protein